METIGTGTLTTTVVPFFAGTNFEATAELRNSLVHALNAEVLSVIAMLRHLSSQDTANPEALVDSHFLQT
jgi:hypothetical protein